MAHNTMLPQVIIVNHFAPVFSRHGACERIACLLVFVLFLAVAQSATRDIQPIAHHHRPSRLLTMIAGTTTRPSAANHGMMIHTLLLHNVEYVFYLFVFQ